jgi:hypothetical protein
LINAAVVETHTVDDALRFRNAEQARPGIAILRPWCDRADFEKTEAQAGQAVNVVAVLVQPGGEANRVGECQPHDLNRAGLYRFDDQAGQTAGVEQRDAAHADTVGGFSIQREEKFADKWI